MTNNMVKHKHNSLDLTNFTEGSGPNRRGWRPWQGCCPRTPRPSPPPTSEAALLQHTSKVMDTKVNNDGKKERETETPFVPVKNFFAAPTPQSMHVFFQVSAKPSTIMSCTISGIHATPNLEPSQPKFRYKLSYSMIRLKVNQCLMCTKPPVVDISGGGKKHC